MVKKQATLFQDTAAGLPEPPKINPMSSGADIDPKVNIVPNVKNKMSYEEGEKSELEGLKETIKQEVKEELVNEQRLASLIVESEIVILRIRNVFPFVLFPDQVVIDTSKVSIIHKNFFASEQIRGVLIKDIANVTVETDIFFATLQIVDRLFTHSPFRVRFLKKSEAMYARRLIQGLIVATNQGVDFTKIEVKDLREKLETLGASRSN